ncbi:MAG: hypothetical protein ACXVLQ_01465 [Bacteriovorax sp.]
MDKIKYNKIRFFYFILIILVAMGMFFQVLKPKSFQALRGMIINDIFMILASYAFLYVLERNNTSFSAERIILNSPQKVVMSWEDLDIEMNDYEPRFFNNGTIYLRSKQNKEVKVKLELNWFNENSVVATILKHAPKNHDLYKVIWDYAEKRGITL